MKRNEINHMKSETIWDLMVFDGDVVAPGLIVNSEAQRESSERFSPILMILFSATVVPS